jgi:hypothetical protein
VLNANIEGLTQLKPDDRPESPFEYTFKIECTSCHEIHPKEVSINHYEQHELPNSRGEANFIFKCKTCGRDSSVQIKPTGKTYDIEDAGKNVAFLEIESRGLELKEFIPLGIFVAKGADTTTKFNDVLLDEGEFYDYDDNAGAEVSITEVKWDIVRS